MRLRLAVVIATFLFLVFLPPGLRQIRPTQHVARVEPSSVKIHEELKSVIDLISDLDSSLTSIRQLPDERWGRNFFKPVIKPRRTTREETEEEKEPSLPHLTSIMVNKQKSYAILDNQIVGVGDIIKNMKVVNIEMGKVTLKAGEKTIILTVD